MKPVLLIAFILLAFVSAGFVFAPGRASSSAPALQGRPTATETPVPSDTPLATNTRKPTKERAQPTATERSEPPAFPKSLEQPAATVLTSVPTATATPSSTPTASFTPLSTPTPTPTLTGLADLNLASVSSPESPEIGGSLTYTLTVQNGQGPQARLVQPEAWAVGVGAGLSANVFGMLAGARDAATAPADDVVLTVTLPEGTTLLQVSASQGTTETNGNVITVSIGHLDPGQSVTVLITIKIGDNLAAGSILQMRYTLTWKDAAKPVEGALSTPLVSSRLPSSGLSLWPLLVGLGLIAIVFGVRRWRRATSR
jgi:hypothetical protein